MHHKDIKLIVRKQLKKEYPKWKQLSKRQKKAIAKMVLDEAVKAYDFDKEVDSSLEELLGIEGQQPTEDIMNLEEMARFVERHQSYNLIKFSRYKSSSVPVEERELKFIDDLLGNRIVNELLSDNVYTPGLREFFPCQFFRAELLKAIKYPEISYRKFCSDEYIGLDRKQNRLFIGLPLNKKKMIDHTQLSQFRSSLRFSQLANLMVYILHHFYQSGFLGGSVIHGVDSTELANDCKAPLASIEVKGQKIRIYNDIDCDCGTRRNKRDKSPYVIGYRLHTLTAINAKTGHSYPLVSLLSPANHHDSNFLTPLVKLGKAMGIDLKLITADEAYTDSDGSLYAETGVHLITPVSSKVKVPAHVDSETKEVTFDNMCEIPMERMGIIEDVHEFKCGDRDGECFRSALCSKYRTIPFDSGHFQPIYHGHVESSQAVDIRKNVERPYNLLKNQTGLENVRVRSQAALLSRSIFSSIGTLLLEMAGTRKKVKPDNRQEELFSEAV